MEDNRKGPGIFYAVVGVATLVVAIVGATFAYFSASATATGNITGETAKGNALSLSVTRTVPVVSNTGKLVPLDVTPASGSGQLASALSNGCIDSNSNVVCHIYDVSVVNASSAALSISVSATVTTGASNLSWKLLTNATTNDTSSSPATITSGSAFYLAGSASTGATLTGSGTNHYYLMIWLEETGSPQDTDDAEKTFSGNVTVNAVDGSGNSQGLTATFTA